MSRRIYRSIAPNISRINADGGIVRDTNNYIQYATMCRQNNIWDNIRVGYISDTGYRLRSSGASLFAERIYNITGENDANQTVANSQPYVFFSGAIKNNNLDTRFVTFPQISFAADEAWSVTVRMLWNGSAISRQNILGRRVDGNSHMGVAHGSHNRFYFRNETNILAEGLQNTTNRMVGRVATVHYVANGLGQLFCYINNVLVDTLTIATNVNLSALVNATADSPTSIAGDIFAVAIRNGVLSENQRAFEHNILQAMFPQPQVTIGAQTFSQHNHEVVCTPQRNFIAHAPTTNTFALAVEGGFEVNLGAWTAGSGATVTREAGQRTGGSGSWVMRVAAGSVQGAMLNVLQQGRLYRIRGWARTNGASAPRVELGGWGRSLWVGAINSLWQQFDVYLIADAGLINVRTATGWVELDDFTIEEVGWADATNVYNNVFAATSGTTAQKTTAALRASAMWCYQSNDVAIGSYQGKLYNFYAAALLAEDIAAWNSANPTDLWGWRVALAADLSALSGAELTTLRGQQPLSGTRGSDGTFSAGTTTQLWASDTTATETERIQGRSIRMRRV